MKRLSGTLLAILLAALLGMGVMAFTTAAPETSAPPASDTDPVPELPEPVREPGRRLTLVNEANPLPEDYEPETAEAQWLKAHCAEYGFILRSPPEKSEITGITWEPWHFRYVGEEAAVYIMENELCLEEYLAEMCAKRE